MIIAQYLPSEGCRVEREHSHKTCALLGHGQKRTKKGLTRVPSTVLAVSSTRTKILKYPNHAIGVWRLPSVVLSRPLVLYSSSPGLPHRVRFESQDPHPTNSFFLTTTPTTPSNNPILETIRSASHHPSPIAAFLFLRITPLTLLIAAPPLPLQLGAPSLPLAHAICACPCRSYFTTPKPFFSTSPLRLFSVTASLRPIPQSSPHEAAKYLSVEPLSRPNLPVRRPYQNGYSKITTSPHPALSSPDHTVYSERAGKLTR
jgi:hypothetical protein